MSDSGLLLSKFHKFLVSFHFFELFDILKFDYIILKFYYQKKWSKKWLKIIKFQAYNNLS